MKLRTALTALVLPVLVCAAGLAANQTSKAYQPPPRSDGFQPVSAAPETIGRNTFEWARQRHYWLEIQKLRHDGLELQQQDGGTLTPEHRAMLQSRLDHINATWR